LALAVAASASTFRSADGSQILVATTSLIVVPMAKLWTDRQSKELQDAVDRIFESAGDRLQGLHFSFTIADPSLPDCPLIGCSSGFGTLCGYDMQDIVGRNCRFLVDPVPKDQLDEDVRRWAKEFCAAVKEGRPYQIPDHERKPYMPASRPSDDGVFLLQMNARKDKTLFKNMFYLKAIGVDDRRYIVGLQTEVPTNSNHDVYHEACRVLDENMGAVERLFTREFWCSFAMRRQDDRDPDDGFTPLPLSQSEEPATLPGTQLGKFWTAEQGAKLQEAVDRVFGVEGSGALKGLQFSLTIADPMMDECPLIGCSTGFGTLCGYEMDEIVGHNCRFLVDPVPKELVNNNVRRLAKQFCMSAREGCEFIFPEEEREPWMPTTQHSDDGLFCAQRNAKKDGSLFANMFYLRRVELDDRPYILGLQTELPAAMLSFNGARGPTQEDDVARMEACHEACRMLDANMADLEKVLASMFWYTAPMRRQDPHEPDEPVPCLAEASSPQQLLKEVPDNRNIEDENLASNDGPTLGRYFCCWSPST